MLVRNDFLFTRDDLLERVRKLKMRAVVFCVCVFFCVGVNREMYKGSHVKEDEDKEEELGLGLMPATRSFSKINMVYKARVMSNWAIRDGQPCRSL
jgi:hypothetical protein